MTATDFAVIRFLRRHCRRLTRKSALLESEAGHFTRGLFDRPRHKTRRGVRVAYVGDRVPDSGEAGLPAFHPRYTTRAPTIMPTAIR